MSVRVMCGDCRDVLAGMEAESFAAQDEQTCRDAEAKIKRLRARRMLGGAPKAEPVDQRQGSLL